MQLALIAWLAAAVCAAEPLFDADYVVVYGRDSCPLTQAMKQELRRAGVPFAYERIDDPATKVTLYERMQQSGLATDGIPLPVVDVSGELRIRPRPEEVAEAYRAGGPAPAAPAP